MTAKMDELFNKLRLIAEAQLARPDFEESLTDPEKILHELHVHQIELEMQNEEMLWTQIALETSRAHYIELYDFAPVGYLTLTAEGVITDINLTGAKLLGKERHYLVNQRFERLIAADYQDCWHRAALFAKQQGDKQTCILSLYRGGPESGTSFFAQLDHQCLQTDDASALLRITLTDVTERQQAEDALRIAAAAFETQNGTIVADANKVILRVNRAFLQMTGYSDDDLIGKPLSVLRSGRHEEDYYRDMWASIDAEGCWQKEIWEMRKDGGFFPAWLTVTVITSADGNISHYVGSFMDITERKQAEQTLRIAAVAFETQDSIMVTDTEHVILRVNPAFSRMTGYGSAEVVGKTPYFLRSERHDEHFYEAIWAAVADTGFWQGEIWSKRKNGEVFPGLQSITAITDEAGNITHHIGYLADITVQKQAEKVLLDARYRLEDKVVNTQEELEQVKLETAEINTALSVLLKSRAATESDTKMALANEIEQTILPFLKKLQKTSAGRRQTNQLLTILEGNLQQLIKDYGNARNLPAAYQQLTPVEAQVASMVRQGLPTKVIAATLNCATGTVSIHRKHIRKKLGLDKKNCNLNTYLLSLTE